MMFSICDEGLSQETHVTLILRLLWGLGSRESARASVLHTQTIESPRHPTNSWTTPRLRPYPGMEGCGACARGLRVEGRI
jgi:hypothetical protein